MSEDEKLIDYIAKTVDESRTLRRVCFDLPEQWLDMIKMIERNRSTGMGYEVKDEDQNALKYMQRIIENNLHDDLHLLCHGEHPTQKPMKPIERGQLPDYGDEFPF